MPLQRNLGWQLLNVVDGIHSERQYVKSANRIEAVTQDLSLVPQVFFPWEQIAVIHLSFLLPLVVAFTAGVGASVKYSRRHGALI
jgi:hypothetical protein